MARQEWKKIKFDARREPIIGVISNQVFAWAKGDFDYLNAGYELIIINEEPIVIKLLPLSPMEKKYIESIVLTFSETENYVKRIEINEMTGLRYKKWSDPSDTLHLNTET